MVIKKFRIKNFKSIVDSGDCYPSDTITIFAGKNESGKTSILQALEDFDTEKNIRDDAKPIKNGSLLPEIFITFNLDKESLGELLAEIGYDYISPTDCSVEIVKAFPNTYKIVSINNEKIEDSGLFIAPSFSNDKWMKIKKIYNETEDLGGELFDLNIESPATNKDLLSKFKSDTEPNLEKIISDEERLQFVNYIKDIEGDILKIEEFINFEDKFIEGFKKYIPNFILFNSFEDVFPNKIPFSELEQNEWIKDLSIISDLKIDTIKNSSDRDKKKHKKDININLNEDYKKFWTQDVSNLSIDWDSESLNFWIEEDDYPYEPSLRSKGRQWHLAFYIKVSARAKENVSNIILIDEPGLFLHAQAQKNILDKLEDSAKDVQLFFSTHSPYLLEANKLDRIKLIYKDNDKGTIIENKIHALADKETLTPILTAIGLEICSGIANIDKVNNVVVEGISDIYYLQAVNLIFSKNISFIFGGGAGNMPFIGTILNGWGGRVLYLYDNDKGKKDGEKNLIKHWFTSKEFVLSILKEEGSIEDLFAREDFKKYILENEEVSYSEKNSEYVKIQKIDKVLLAKKFIDKMRSEKIEESDLNSKTVENFKELFKSIEEKFS